MGSMETHAVENANEDVYALCVKVLKGFFFLCLSQFYAAPADPKLFDGNLKIEGVYCHMHSFPV